MTDLDVRVSAPLTPPSAASSSRRWWVLAVLGIAQLMVVLDATIVNIALPHAQSALHFSNDDRQWIVTAYSLAFGSLLLLAGRIADLFGRKRVFLVGVIGFAVASAVGGAAPNFAMLVASRAVQGAFGALLAPASLSLLTTTFVHPAERGKAFGIYGGIAGSGSSVGLLLGGLLTEYLNWRWTMYINVAFAVVAAVAGAALLDRHSPDSRQRLDTTGTVLVSAGLFAVVYGFAHAATKTGTAGWTDAVTIGFLVVGVALVAAFVAWQRRAPHPLLPQRVVLDRDRGGAYAAMFLAAIGIFGVFLFLTYYLETSRGYSAVRTGLAFLPMTVLIVLVAALANTVLLARISSRVLLPSGLVLSAIGMAMLTRIGLQSSYATTILPAMLVTAVGLGLVFAPCFTLGTTGVGEDDAGVASATINVAQQIGGSIGTALLNTIATTAVSSYVAAHVGQGPMRMVQAAAAVHGYTVVFWVGAAVFLVAALLVGPLLRPGVPDLAATEQLALQG
jgi:EmrB/QacA subfamily drug resistance transporter